MKETISTLILSVPLLLLAPLTAFAHSTYHEQQAEIRQKFDAEASRNQSFWDQHAQREQRMRESRDRQIEQNMQRDQHRERMDLLRQSDAETSRNRSTW